MKKKFIRLIGLCLAGAIGLTGCFGGSSKTGTTNETESTSVEDTSESKDKEAKKTDGEPIVIRFGSHTNDDPDAKDPVTGEYISTENAREVTKKALDKVLEELNVKIEFVAFPGDTTEVLLQSVLAGDPISDLVRLYTNSQGIILGQNVLQPIDDYLEYFSKDSIIPPKLYGKHYFVSVGGNGSNPLSPLIYNIDYIEAVDALKVDGKTVYPTDLYKEGKWTWSTFKDYLSKISAHYANSQGPVRPEMKITSYRTDYTEVLTQAIHSGGGSIYGEEGLAIDSDATKAGVAYVNDLLKSGLLQYDAPEPGQNRGAWNAQAVPFENGESVFTNLEDWRITYATNSLGSRNQSIGMIPFPRADFLEVGDPRYRQVRTGSESFALLKGIDKDKIPLTIQAFEMYNAEKSRLWAELSDGESLPGGLRDTDTFHEVIGQDMVDIMKESAAATVVNEYSNMMNIYWDAVDIMGDAIWGVDGSPAYDVAVESKKKSVEEKIASIEQILEGSEAKDNIKPVYTQVEEGKIYSFPKGTDPSTIDWNSEFTVKDNIDGELDQMAVVYDQSKVDYNTAGYYERSVIGSITDSSDNVSEQKVSVIVYDGESTTPPKLTLKTEYRDIKVGEDTANINWANDFVDVATDKDGIDIKSLVVADLSEIDTSQVGKSNVKIIVTDYAGNQSSVLAVINVVEAP